MTKSSLSAPRESTSQHTILPELVVGMAAVVLLAFVLQFWLATSSAWIAGSVLAYIGVATAIWRYWPGRRGTFGWPNRVTLARAVLVAVLAGVLTLPEILQRHGSVLAALAVAAIVLDGLDGRVARLVDGATQFGARFDMEIDALLILVLSLAVVLADRAGSWVLMIGGIRYAFVAIGRAMPWLRRELPFSRWRKFICVMQGVVLAAALVPWLPAKLVQVSLALSLGALLYSFARDSLWLWQRRDQAS